MFNIYRVNANGTASWVDTATAETGPAALLAAYERHQQSRDPLITTGETYFVVDPARNPTNKQCLLQVEQSAVVARPVGL